MTNELGARLREERNRLEFSQPKLAEAVGVSKNTVIAWEKGTTSPTAVQLSGLSVMCFDVLYILTGNRSVPTRLSTDELALLDNYRASSDENKYHLKAVGAALAQSSLKLTSGKKI
ncbi:MAG: helix-turn-helix transcriptional regulator [Nitrincola lacisaponensis]|uniref:helix-turn-helix transcriptional regulator n=1 Tax=Nitrincola lacisaponensis TaxID=267850 RepID=UPI00391A0E3F